MSALKGINMKLRLLLLSALLLVTAACAPQVKTVPASEPIFYDGSLDRVYAAVVQAISTSPGIDDSTGWTITQSDIAGGFIRGETIVTKRGFFGSSEVTEGISVIVSNDGANRTQVVIQASEGAQVLAERVREQLDLKFLRL